MDEINLLPEQVDKNSPLSFNHSLERETNLFFNLQTVNGANICIDYWGDLSPKFLKQFPVTIFMLVLLSV